MQTNLTLADIDATEGAAIVVRGFRLANVAARSAALKTPLAAFQCDLVYRDGKLYLLLRGGLPTDTLTEDHLGARIYGEDYVPPISRRRQGEGRLHKALTITFIDYDKSYEPGSQTANRLASAGGTESTIQLAVAMTNDEAIQAANKILHSMNIESVRYALSGMPSTADILQPGAVVDLDVDGEVHTVRVDSAHITTGGIVTAEALRYDASAYSDEAVGGTPEIDPRVIGIPGSTIAIVMNLPALSSTVSGNGVMVAVTSRGDEWRGAAIFTSTDGIDYTSQESASARATAGIVAAPTYTPELTNTVDLSASLTLTPITGTFSSIDLATAMASKTQNYAAYGRTGRFEIVRFMSADVQPDGSVIISGIHHGIQDTGAFSAQHQAGDYFVLLDANTLSDVAVDISNRGSNVFLKAVTFGTSLESTQAVPFNYLARQLIPFAPHSLHAEYAGSSWTLSWSRQDRVQAAMLQEPGLNDPRSYVVSLLSAGGDPLTTYQVDGQEEITLYNMAIPKIRWGVAQIGTSAIEGNRSAASNGGGAADYDTLAVADPDLVDYWPMSFTNPSQTVSTSNSGTRNLTFFGNPEMDGAPIRDDDDPSVVFDPNDRASKNSVDMTPIKSLSFWVALTDNHADNRALIVYATSGVLDGSFYVSIDSSKVLTVTQYNTNGTVNATVVSDVALAVNARHFFAINIGFSAGESLELYRSGVLVDSAVLTNSWAWNASSGSWFLITGEDYLHSTSSARIRMTGMLATSAKRTEANLYPHAMYEVDQ